MRVVRTLDDLQRVFVLRGVTYMAEQDCPYDEEFDGNDLCAMHLLATKQGEPVGSLRLRFFSDFCKGERVCIHPRYRGDGILEHLTAHAFEIAARKGYRRMLGHIQARLKVMWKHTMSCDVRDEAEGFAFSGLPYLAVEIPLPEHPDTIGFKADPFLLLRPEGDWDRPGVLDPSDATVTA